MAGFGRNAGAQVELITRSGTNQYHGAAFDYLRNVNSGHPGSITSVHAASAELAFEQLVLLVKQNQGGRDLARIDIKSLLYLLIDVVIQFGVESHERFIKEIWYEPERKRS